MDSASKTPAMVILSLAFPIPLTGCTNERATDQETCKQILNIFAPMNDGSDPDLAKWDKAYPEVRQLSENANDAELKSSLSNLAESIRTFVFTIRADGKAPTLVGPLDSDFQAGNNACEAVLTSE